MRRRWRLYKGGHEPGPWCMWGSTRWAIPGMPSRASVPPTEHDSNRNTGIHGFYYPWVYLVEEVPDGE